MKSNKSTCFLKETNPSVLPDPIQAALVSWLEQATKAETCKMINSDGDAGRWSQDMLLSRHTMRGFQELTCIEDDWLHTVLGKT